MGGNMDKLKYIDLFAGVGGIRLGFDDENTECVFSSEWDKFAQQTYEANFREKPAGDIKQIKASDIPNHDVLLGGFPCQPFSNIGKRNGFSDENQGTLFFDILRILQYHQPSMFLLENVPGILTIDGGKTFEVIMESLENAGYNVFYDVLDAKNFGLAQNRKRVIFVGFHKGLGIDEFIFRKVIISLINMPKILLKKMLIQCVIQFLNTFKKTIYLRKMMEDLKLSMKILSFK